MYGQSSSSFCLLYILLPLNRILLHSLSIVLRSNARVVRCYSTLVHLFNLQFLLALLRTFSNEAYLLNELLIELLLLLAFFSSLLGLFGSSYAHKESQYLSGPISISCLFLLSYILYVPYYLILQPFLEAVFSYESDFSFSSENSKELTFMSATRVAINALLSLVSLAAFIVQLLLFYLISRTLRGHCSFLFYQFSVSAPFTVLIGGSLFFMESFSSSRVSTRIRSTSVFVTFFKLYPSVVQNHFLPLFIVLVSLFVLLLMPLLFISAHKGRQHSTLTIVGVYSIHTSFITFFPFVVYCLLKCLIYENATSAKVRTNSFPQTSFPSPLLSTNDDSSSTQGLQKTTLDVTMGSLPSFYLLSPFNIFFHLNLLLFTPVFYMLQYIGSYIYVLAQVVGWKNYCTQVSF